jgi:cold shock CspA family protein
MIDRRNLIQGLLTFATVAILPSAPAIVRPSRASDVIRISGRVKWFDVMRGYGFIVPDNGLPDILLHLSCVKRCGLDAPIEGTRVICEVVFRQKGYQCLSVALSPIGNDSEESSLRHALIALREHLLDQAERRAGAITEMMLHNKFGADLYYARMWHRIYTDLAARLSSLKPEDYNTDDDLYDGIDAQNVKAFGHLPQQHADRTYAWRVLEYRIAPKVDHYYALWLKRGLKAET